MLVGSTAGIPCLDDQKGTTLSTNSEEHRNADGSYLVASCPPRPMGGVLKVREQPATQPIFGQWHRDIFAMRLPRLMDHSLSTLSPLVNVKVQN